MSTVLRIGGVDPGMRKTGVVVVEIDAPGRRSGEVFIPGEDQVRVLFHHTVRPKGESFVDRIRSLKAGLALELIDSKCHSVDRWCFEDPRNAARGAMHQRSRSNEVTLGMACGIALGALVQWTKVPITLVPVRDWLPKTRGHPMKHADARDWLKARWPALEPLTDDEVFASGMVIWQATGGAVGALTT